MRSGLAKAADGAKDPMDAALGAAIRMRRRAIGMSQVALSERCDVSFQQIQKYENGGNRVSFSRLVQIARALECRVSQLVEVLELTGEPASVELDLTPQISTPGAAELLDRFEQLPPYARAALVNFTQAMSLAQRASHPEAGTPLDEGTPAWEERKLAQGEAPSKGVRR